MDFFAEQHQARRRTTLMVLLFLLAVAAIVFAVNLFTAAVWLALAKDVMLSRREGLLGQVPATVYWIGSLAALAVIAYGTVYRVIQLSQGGVAVARMVGARWLKRNAQDPAERRLLNVVEEMAIASGIRVPAVFVMDEERGINAFAAGYSPNDAAITVTRGALETLSRDELQGVIGHEFSHVLNGDMRLNVRLVGVIAGIVLIGTIGRFLMSPGRTTAGGGFSGRRRGDLGLFFAGLALWLIGGIGVLFGQIIKAAVSREREYLADAASVQFTRNPEGIAGALFKIGRTSGAITGRYAEELSHMYFGASTDASVFSLFATHPPIEDRIRRVLGGRTLLFMRIRERELASGRAGVAAPAQVAPARAFAGAGDAALGVAAPAALAGSPAAPLRGPSRRAGDETVRTSAGAVMASVGSPTTVHIEYARRLLDSLPDEVREALGSPDEARSVLLALLLAAGGEVRTRQLAMIRSALGEIAERQAVSLQQAIQPFDARARLPVLDLAIPALRELPQGERDRLLHLIKDLIDADRRVSLFEFVLVTICRREFDERLRGARPVRYRTVQSVSAEVAIIASLLLRAGRNRPEAFDGAMKRLGLSGQRLRDPAQLGIAAVQDALLKLDLLAPLAKPAVIKACLEVIMSNGVVSVAEAELMRAVCAAIDTPVPPILDTPAEEYSQ